ncbi:hypothetical protein [Corallococcus carmarthensis]|uniref:hypothetical protein n=1 Tax=Corallococcus carmarthensis TaxID=2316728 RepID=UPI00148D3C42|nr:hypothetical protein [Corallococcus carmarthensis]NOK18200.1 hypothetical protein [Corallococcus carmarthensis]
MAIFGGLLVVALGAITALALTTHTRYAPGYSEAAFEKVSAGARPEEVTALLGQPLSRETDRAPERWCYGARAQVEVEERRSWLLWSTQRFKLPQGPPCLVFDDAGRVREVVRDRDDRFGSMVGKSKPDVLRAVGEPMYQDPARTCTVLFYSALDGDDGSYKVRSVVLDEGGLVLEKVAYTLWD